MWQKPLNNLLIGLVDIRADIAADELVVCIMICRSGHCVVATDAVLALQWRHRQKQPPQRLSCHKTSLLALLLVSAKGNGNELLLTCHVLLLILLLVILLIATRIGKGQWQRAIAYMPCIAADFAAGDPVVCIRICTSGYCDVATRLLHMFCSYPSRVQLVLYSWFTRLLLVF